MTSPTSARCCRLARWTCCRPMSRAAAASPVCCRWARSCAAEQIRLSAPTSPAIHAHVCAAIEPVVHIEYFHDHARIEAMLFDGLPDLLEGELCPDRERPGHGLELRESDAARYAR